MAPGAHKETLELTPGPVLRPAQIPAGVLPGTVAGTSTQVRVPQEEAGLDAMAAHTSSSSSSEDKLVLMGSSLPQNNLRAHQNLLKWVASNLGLQAEVVREQAHGFLDILLAAALAKVALLLHNAILGPIKAIWQTPASISPTAKKILCACKRL